MQQKGGILSIDQSEYAKYLIDDVKEEKFDRLFSLTLDQTE